MRATANQSTRAEDPLYHLIISWHRDEDPREQVMRRVADTTLEEGSVTMETSDPSVERIKREARVVGLREVSTPTLEAVERRRLQLWGLTVMLLLAV